jgi:hypothetical protein
MLNYESAAVPKFAEQRAITAIGRKHNCQIKKRTNNDLLKTIRFFLDQHTELDFYSNIWSSLKTTALTNYSDSETTSICSSAKHASLRRKNKYWLSRNQNNLSERLFSVSSIYYYKNPTQCVGLEKSG